MGQILGYKHGTSSVDKVDPRLWDIVQTAIAASPYDAIVRSGAEPRSANGANHNKGWAVDVTLVDPATGEKLPDYQNGSSFAAYETYAQAARVAQQEKYPELSDVFRWGGYFSKNGKATGYGAVDLMHLDIRPSAKGAMALGSWEKGASKTLLNAYPDAVSNGGLGGANGSRLVAQYQQQIKGGPRPPADIPAPQPLMQSPEMLAFRSSGAATSDNPQRDLLAFLEDRAKAPSMGASATATPTVGIGARAEGSVTRKKDLVELLDTVAMSGNSGKGAMSVTPRLPDGFTSEEGLPADSAERKRLGQFAVPMDVSGVQARAILMDEGAGALMNGRSFSPAKPNPGQANGIPFPLPLSQDMLERRGLVAPTPLPRPAQFAQPQPQMQAPEPAPQQSAPQLTSAPAPQTRQMATLPSGKQVEVGRIYSIGGEDFIGGQKDGVGTLTRAPASILDEAKGNSVVGHAVRDEVVKRTVNAAKGGVAAAVDAAPAVAKDAMAGLSAIAGNVGNMFGGMFGGGGNTASPVTAPAAKPPVQGLIKLRPGSATVAPTPQVPKPVIGQPLEAVVPKSAAELVFEKEPHWQEVARQQREEAARPQGPQGRGGRRGAKPQAQQPTVAPVVAPQPLTRPTRFSQPQSSVVSVRPVGVVRASQSQSQTRAPSPAEVAQAERVAAAQRREQLMNPPTETDWAAIEASAKNRR